MAKKHTLIKDFRIFPVSKKQSVLFCPDRQLLFQIDDAIKDVLADGSNLQKKGPGEALRELESMCGQGVFDAPLRGSRRKRRYKIRRLELHISNSCNLACSYCFAMGGDYGLRIKNKNMKWRTARRVIDYLLEQNRGSRDAVSIQFFGGEPLLNIAVLKKSLAYIEEKCKNDRYPYIEKSIATNGTLFTDEAIDILRRYNCVPWVSLDACAASHDKNRPYRQGGPSFKDIIKGLKRVRDIAPGLPVVICTTLGIEDDLEDIIRRQSGLDSTHLNLKVRFSLYDKCEYRRSDYNGLLTRMKEGLKEMHPVTPKNKRYSSFMTPFMFYHLHTGSAIYSGCGAGINRLAVNSDGDVFICSVGMSAGEKLCNISEDSFREKIKKKVDSIYAGSRADEIECANCWSRNLCNGPCILGRETPSALPGKSRVCDFIRLLNEFYIRSYAAMEYKDAEGLFGLHRDTEGLLRKIMLLYEVRDIKNQGLKHIKYLTPVTGGAQP